MGRLTFYLNHKEENMENPHIRFINALYETLFFVEDGGEIEVDIDGEWKRYVCRYIDEYHTWIGDRVYHIYEFAEIMERNIRTYRPATNKEETNA
jgi:hypothetical protein